ncbi:VanZ family protein [Halalkalibacter alkalisediminis]|uniref:VanZ family protein n=1 Tax=Halalkalibacter alkalisediminis TaxID=935616 RepID=A0ABV6NL70_9BACI|nr:VanZ family protein [Halalkalibacter alkalisediminis]
MFLSFITFLGSIVLALYILIDLISNRFKNIKKRIIFYSFIFYLIHVVHFTVGILFYPPIEDTYVKIQFIPFYFIYDLYLLNDRGNSWYFWNAVKLSFFNLIMLLPLGAYLSLLFRINSIKKAIFITFLVSLFIESYQLILESLGFTVGRTFNVDDLILNTLGGLVGFVMFSWGWKTYNSVTNYKRKSA